MNLPSLANAADFMTIINEGGTIVAHPDTLESFRNREDIPRVLMLLAEAFLEDRLIANEMFEPGKLFAVPSLDAKPPRVVRWLEAS